MEGVVVGVVVFLPQEEAVVFPLVKFVLEVGLGHFLIGLANT